MSSADSSKYILEDHNYGKNGVKILHLVRDGDVHSIKEFEVSMRLKLGTLKDYMRGDNSDIVDADSQKNMVYLVAKKHGIKTPEDFGVMLCELYMSTYDHVLKATVNVEELSWDRVSYANYGNGQLHNHAFVHKPVGTRSATIVLKKNEKYPVITSSIKDLRVVKTAKSSFVNFIQDQYRTYPDMEDRVLSTIAACSWTFSPNAQVDYDKVYDGVRECILWNFGGDLQKGVQSYCVQNNLYVTAKDILDKMQEIESVEMTMPNVHYVNVDFSKFKTIVRDDEKTVFLPMDKPHGVVYAKVDRKTKTNKL